MSSADLRLAIFPTAGGPITPGATGGSRRLSRRLAAAGARGFSLIEMVVVVAIVGILAAAAAPSVVNILRDRRVNRAAMRVVDIYRSARAKAMGRGVPVLVSWNASAGTFTTLEPYITLTGIVPSCGQANWASLPVATPADNAIQQTDVFNVNSYEQTSMSVLDYNVPGITATTLQICFGSNGRSYARTAVGNTFTPMTGVPQISITNTANPTPLVRKVFVPPNGVARIQQ